MRHIVYLLLVSNLVYLGWNVFQQQGLDAGATALPPLPAGVRPLVTLQEQSADRAEAVDVSELDALTAAYPPAAIAIRQCQVLGPFMARPTVEKATRRLTEAGLDPVLRMMESQEDNGFWVYIPSVDRAHSREIVQQLKERGDENFFVGKDWVVSLGSFEDLARAQVRHTELDKMGFETILEQRYRTQQEYWLELPENVPNTGLLTTITVEHPGLQLLALSCR